MWWRRAGRHSSQPEESKWLGLFLPKHQARQTTVSGSPLKCGGEVSGGEVKREGGNGQVLMGRCQSSGDCGKWRCFRLLRSLPAADGLASMPKASRSSPRSTSSSFVGSADTGARYVTNATVSRDNLEILPTIAFIYGARISRRTALSMAGRRSTLADFNSFIAEPAPRLMEYWIAIPIWLSILVNSNPAPR